MQNLFHAPGDQRKANAAVFDDFDRSLDQVGMGDVADENTQVWCQESRAARTQHRETRPQ